MKCITLAYGAEEPLVLEVDDDALVADCRGPAGVIGEAARTLVTAAVAATAFGPPLELHVVPGDRVVIGLAGDVPQAVEVVTAVAERLIASGVDPADITLLHAPTLDGVSAGTSPPLAIPPGMGTVALFDPTAEPQTSYVDADEAGRPIHLARLLVDADVVVGVGSWGWDAAFGGRSIEGELWPTFSRKTCRQELVKALAKRGRQALAPWRMSNHEATWRLGMCASLRVIAGQGGTLATAAFGLPESVAENARVLAAGWSPLLKGVAMTTIASLSDPRGGLAMLLRAVSAAARVTHPTGTVCIASRLAERPGVIFARWREGAPLDQLVREAVGTGDPSLINDAFQTRFFARALGERRLVLLSDLDEATVEELELGFAAKPEVVERLAHRSDSVVVIHEADRMLPRVT